MTSSSFEIPYEAPPSISPREDRQSEIHLEIGISSSERAFTKLGVNEETVRLEKLMKKLGVCDHDLEEFKMCMCAPSVRAFNLSNDNCVVKKCAVASVEAN
jgi:hypothetical protein